MEYTEVAAILQWSIEQHEYHVNQITRLRADYNKAIQELGTMRARNRELTETVENMRFLAAEDDERASEEEKQELAHRRAAGYPGFTQ